MKPANRTCTLPRIPSSSANCLGNLRMPRAFLLLFAYVALLGGVVYLAWPQAEALDFAQPEEAKRLVNLFFLGQYMLASLMTPSFAAGAITGEKERKSYEMLLASPLRPGAIVLGKLLASLCHLAILMICSLPIVMLCLPLGGVSPYEVFAAYIAMISSVVLLGMISLWAAAISAAPSASLVVSYLMILPLALVGVLFWNALGTTGRRAAAVRHDRGARRSAFRFRHCLWSRPPVADCCIRPTSAAKARKWSTSRPKHDEAVGLYIKRDEFPDRLFAPPKRTTFLEDGANPIYDKEMRSEIFSQGTLMLRLVIQISMLLALPVMAVCLYIWPAIRTVVHLLRAAVQHAGRARVLGRQRDAANANARRSTCC